MRPRPTTRVLLSASLLLCVAACGGSDEAAEARDQRPTGTAATDSPPTDIRTAGLSASTEPALVAGDDKNEKPSDDAIRFRRSLLVPGDHFVAKTRLELKLDAQIGVGFLSQEVAYRREEEEVLAVTILPEEDGNLRRSLEFRQRRTSTTLPIVGKETEDRRVAGKTLTVLSTEDGDTIYNKSGGEVNEKLAKEVGYSLRILGRKPVLFSVLPSGAEVSLEPGTTWEVQGEAARRIVGLPFEELGVDSLQLTLRHPDTPDDPLATFDTSASFSGSAVLGDSHLQLTASLSGQVVVVRNTMRIASVELKGHVDAQHEPAPGAEAGLLSATGNGPLVIRRKITSD